MSPNSRGKSKKQRARSVEGLLETTVEPDSQVHAQVQMKKAKSLEEYLDKRDDDDDDDSCSVSASVGDGAKKRNFVNKCINKMKSLMTTTAKKTTPDSSK